MINATWCISLNVGDAITPFLVEKITGQLPIYAAPQPEKVLLGAGSILNLAQAKNVVWGAGLAAFTDQVCAEADIRSVRGPLSRARAISCGASCPESYGDPALLLAGYIDPSPTVGGRIGVIPHYADQQRADWWYRQAEDAPDVTIINVFQDVESFVADVTACHFVFSSSLHGLIVADAYGIPNVWVKMSDSVGGDGMKFMDHLLSVGRPVVEPIDLRENHDLRLGDLEQCRSWYRTTIDTAAIWDACPFKDGGLK